MRRTLKEAQGYRYGKWGGNPAGNKYVEGRCAYECSADTWIYHQCSRKNGHGPAGLYCKQHAKKVGGEK